MPIYYIQKSYISFLLDLCGKRTFDVFNDPLLTL